jgi:predicted RNase H-related nuclease YkuK (DUF458 family)
VKLKSDRGYRPFNEWLWRNYDGDKKVVVDDFLAAHSEDFFMIGTDSQNYSKKRNCIFTTVLIAYKLGKGGSVILHKDKVPFIDSLRQRLLLEAMRSLEVAWYMDSKVPSKNVIEIHLDINSNLRYRSSQYKNELIGLVSSQGFQCLIKPDAWAASGAADRKC